MSDTLAKRRSYRRVAIEHMVCLYPETKSLLEEVNLELEEEPWLVPNFPPIHEKINQIDEIFIGIIELRFALMHTRYNPLIVGEEPSFLARQLISKIFEIEKKYVNQVCQSCLLIWQTLQTLHPYDEKFFGFSQIMNTWESTQKKHKNIKTWLHQKYTQNILFFRYGFFSIFYQLRKKRIRRHLPKSIQQNYLIMNTFEAIESAGPIVDNFVLNQGFSATLNDHVLLCDFAFLYMQLADEFLDCFFKKSGLCNTLNLIDQHYHSKQLIPLESLKVTDLSNFSISKNDRIDKYNLSFFELLEMLCSLKELILEQLRKNDFNKSVQQNLSSFFHHCFSTFLDEINLLTSFENNFSDQLHLSKTSWHYYRKNNLVMSRWLAMRTTILGADPIFFHHSLHQWGYILASFQIFDDLKDIPIDLKIQANYPLQRSYQLYPDEYKWCSHYYQNHCYAIDRNDVPILSFHMKKTIFDTIQYSRLISIVMLDWFSHYVVDYRWRRNWFVRKKSFHYDPKNEIVVDELVNLHAKFFIQTKSSLLTAIFRVIAETKSLALDLQMSDEYLAWVLDVVGYDYSGAIIRATWPNVVVVYRYMFLRTIMSAHEKADIVRKICQKNKEDCQMALCSFRWLTGSIKLTHMIADAIHVKNSSYDLPISLFQQKSQLSLH